MRYIKWIILTILCVILIKCFFTKCSHEIEDVKINYKYDTIVSYKYIRDTIYINSKLVVNKDIVDVKYNQNDELISTRNLVLNDSLGNSVDLFFDIKCGVDSLIKSEINLQRIVDSVFINKDIIIEKEIIKIKKDKYFFLNPNLVIDSKGVGVIMNVGYTISDKFHPMIGVSYIDKNVGLNIGVIVKL